MTAGPDVKVEIAFDSGYGTAAASRTWTDVSTYVNAEVGLTITRGRQDELGQTQPSQLTVTLDNTDGRFTAGLSTGAYYPNVKRGRPIRVTATWNAVTYTRFLGYVNEWPTVWDQGVAQVSTVTITASSRLARLAQGNELRSIIEEEYLYDVPTAYYPLGEPEGSTSAASVATTPHANLTVKGDGAAVVFGNATGPGTDDLTAATFAGGKYLRAIDASPFVAASETDVLLEGFFNTSVSATTQVFALLSSADGSVIIYLSVDSSNHLHGEWALGGGPIASVTSASSVNDGETHHAAVRLNVSGGNYDASLFLDGVEVDTDAGATAQTIPAMDRLFVGASIAGIAPFTGTVAHVAITTTAVADARVTAHSDSGLTGFEGESSDERIARFARFAGIPTAEQALETGSSTSMAVQHTDGKSVIDVMREVETTENGVLFDAGDGTLTFHARSHRYTASSSFTLNASTGQVESGLSSKLDDQFLLNDVSASREEGPTARSVNTTSINDYGVYRANLQLITTDDDELDSAAAWRVFLYAEPSPRVPELDVDVLNQQTSTALVASLLAADIGTRFTVSNLPTQAPSSSLDLFIEGVTDNIGPESYAVSFNTSPVTGLDVWTVGDAVFGQYDAYPIAY